MQRGLWAHDEWKHTQRQKHALSRGAGRTRQRSFDIIEGGSALGGGARSRRRPLVQKAVEAPYDSEQKRVALHRRMQDLAATGISIPKLSGGLGVVTDSCGLAGGTAFGSAKRGKCKGATPSAAAGTPSPFSSHAESLLPATPVRSQCAAPAR